MNYPKPIHLPHPDLRQAADPSPSAAPPPLRFEGLTLDPAARTLADAGGREVALRRSEFELLLAFVRNPGRALTRDTLLTAVAGRRLEPFDRSIDVLVARLRRKIEPDLKRPRLVLTVPGVGYRFAGKPRRASTSPEHETGEPALQRKPKLVVLPFANISGDGGQDRFADGLAEDIITELTRGLALLVIARKTGFPAAGRGIEAKDVARQLGAGYVLEGSLRRNGLKVRVSPQLVDAETGNHLWARRYDRDLEDVFAVQDEIAREVALAVEIAVVGAERQRALRNPPQRLGVWQA